MTAMKKDELERLEAEFGLEPDGLSYQHRCSRIAAYQKGEEWTPPEKKPAKRELDPDEHAEQGYFVSVVGGMPKEAKGNPLYGKKLLITPLMTPDAKRNIAYNELLGPDIVVHEFDAGQHIYGAPEEVDRMVGDYEIDHVDPSRMVYAKTTFPKIGTEITYRVGIDLAPVVRGNDHKVGYHWTFPSCILEFVDGDESWPVQVQGLKSLIMQIYPEILPKFSGKPIMDYIDGITLAADIRETHRLIEEARRQWLLDERAGLR